MILNVLTLIACALGLIAALLSGEWLEAIWIVNCATWVGIAWTAEARQ